MPERQIKIIVLSQRKMFQLSLYDFGGHILFYMYDHFELVPLAKPWILARKTTLQHDMSRNFENFENFEFARQRILANISRSTVVGCSLMVVFDLRRFGSICDFHIVDIYSLEPYLLFYHRV